MFDGLAVFILLRGFSKFRLQYCFKHVCGFTACSQQSRCAGDDLAMNHDVGAVDHHELGAEQLAQIKDVYVAMSLVLQRAFGLRREEAIKFMPSYADQGDHLRLKRSWTKGGKPRVIPIRTETQRSVLQQAHRLTGKGSLIPSTKNYVQQLHTYERLTSRAGLSKLHGLRHAYAQARYQELTGWLAPNAGGPARSALTAEHRIVDERSRLTVSEELGHSRIEITSVYLG